MLAPDNTRWGRGDGALQRKRRLALKGESCSPREKSMNAFLRHRQFNIHPPSERLPRHWPRLMRAETAAAYTDEKSVKSFLRRAGTVYPTPLNIPGRGRVWTKESLDEAIDRLSRSGRSRTYLADDL